MRFHELMLDDLITEGSFMRANSEVCTYQMLEQGCQDAF